jgi:predicted nucleotidyltransferase
MKPEVESLAVPPEVKRVLSDFLEAATQGLGPALSSVVLFGSAAEGRLRPTSDVNLILVLTAFERDAVDRIREPLRIAQAAIQLRPMFLLASEIAPASEVFAQKFADVLRRRRVLHGSDAFASLSVPREAEMFQLKQQLLNLIVRLRAAYVLRSLREEQLALVIADAAGPLRSAAAALLELEGHPADSPKQALETVAASLDGAGWTEALSALSQAREKRAAPSGAAGDTLFRLIDLARRMRERAEALFPRS